MAIQPAGIAEADWLVSTGMAPVLAWVVELEQVPGANRRHGN